MLESATAKNDLPLEASIPHGGASLESILCTEELRRRPWRPPDHAKENRALVGLAGALADSRQNILHALAETILQTPDSDSSGLSPVIVLCGPAWRAATTLLNTVDPMLVIRLD